MVPTVQNVPIIAVCDQPLGQIPLPSAPLVPDEVVIDLTQTTPFYSINSWASQQPPNLSSFTKQMPLSQNIKKPDLEQSDCYFPNLGKLISSFCEDIFCCGGRHKTNHTSVGSANNCGNCGDCNCDCSGCCTNNCCGDCISGCCECECLCDICQACCEILPNCCELLLGSCDLLSACDSC